MPSTKTSPTYNLGAITRETGLNADTLRAWERRYKLPQPARSAGGQRLYSPRDLEILKWLISRQNEGMRISQAAKLWHNQVAEGLNPLEEIKQDKIHVPMPLVTGENIATFKSQWVTACKSFNEAEAEQIISEAFSQYSPEAVCFEVLFAGLSDIGAAWYRGEASVQQEHFASALVARRLHTLISGAPLPNRDERIVVATPPNEEHTLSSLLITFLLRRRGWDVIYLGADVPFENFGTTIESLQPDLVILTAQQLTAAASLLDLADELVRLRIPLAFGGLIFNNILGLRERIPGQFLGEEIDKVVIKVEQILQNPPKIEERSSLIGSPSVERFRLIIPKIESRVHEEIATNPILNSAHSKFLSRDILAALKLGELDLLNNDMDWVRVLLTNSQIPDDALREFLQIYHQAAGEFLESPNEPILFWLQTEINRLKDSETIT